MKKKTNLECTVYKFQDFLSLRFYVKSFLENLEVLKLSSFEILWSLNFDISVSFSLQKAQKFEELKFRASKWVEMLDFALIESPNQYHVNLKR